MPVYGTVYEFFLGITLIFLVFHIPYKNVFRNTRLQKSIALFLGWVLISLCISVFRYDSIQNLLAALYFARLAFYFVFFLYFSAYCKKYPEALKYLSIVVISTIVITVIFSVVQYALYPNIGNVAYLGWDPHLFRLVGLFFDPPVTASLFVLFALFIMYYRNKSVFTYLSILILSILFVLTYSRGGFLALLVTLAVYSFRKMKVAYLLVFVAVGLLLYIVVPKNLSEGLNLTRTTSIKTRFIDYEKAFKIWQKSPVVGIGYNHIRAEKDKYEEEPLIEKYNPSHASASFHSSFLIVLVTSGIIGLLLFCIMLWQLSQVHLFAYYGVIFLSVYSLTDNVLLHPFILFVFFSAISIMVGLTRLSRK